MAQLEGKTALVTGGSRGIGRAVALALAEAGANVCINYLAQRDAADEVCAAIREKGRKSLAVQADVSRSDQVSRLVAQVREELGSVDILINNAGVAHKDKLENMTEADWDRVMAINLKSAFLVTQAVLPGMRENRWGRIVNMSSVAAHTGGVTGPIYVASKAGMIGLTHSYASLLVKEGIMVNSVAPALIETDMVTKDLKATPAPIPLGRFGTAEEIAEVVVMVVNNGYMTGQTINVNGGWYFS